MKLEGSEMKSPKKAKKAKDLKTKQKIKGGVASRVSALTCHDNGLTTVSATACLDPGRRRK